jgi:hypothetical protein
LNALVPGRAAQVVYSAFFEVGERGLTMLELRERVGPEMTKLGLAAEQEQLDRRKRDLHRSFTFDQVREGRSVRHILVGRRTAPLPERGRISLKDRAIVLQPGRCAMCGRTPLDDGVKLVVDHRVPLGWGGTNEIDNLQPLCEDCNAGKKAHFADFDDYADAIKEAAANQEPHRRIGELLKALQGLPVPSDLIGVVAGAGSYQEDWQKRLRELRLLGWTIEVSRKKLAGRTQTSYRLTHWEPWPEGKIRSEISHRERERRKAKDQPP